MFDINSGYIQVLVRSGHIFDVSYDVHKMILDEIEGSKIIQFEDIYGGSCTINPVDYTGSKEWSLEYSIIYKTLNEESNGFQES